MVGMDADPVDREVVGEEREGLAEVGTFITQHPELGMAHADRGDEAPRRGQNLVHAVRRIVAREFEMHRVEPPGAPVTHEAEDARTFPRHLGRRHGAEPRHEPGARLPGAITRRGVKGRVMFETEVGEAHDDARRAVRHDLADGVPGRIFEDEHLRARLPARHHGPGRHQRLAFGQQDVGRHLLQHGGGTILQRQQRRRARRREDPGRMGAGAAHGALDPAMGRDPGRPCRPVIGEFAADAPRGPILQDAGKGRGFGRRCGEGHREVVQRHARIDADAHAAQGQRRPGGLGRQVRQEGRIAGRPVFVHSRLQSRSNFFHFLSRR